MPFVEISIWKEVMDDSKKEKLIKKVSEDISEIMGTPLYAVEIIINEVPKSNWGKGGIQASKWSQGQFSLKG